MNKKMGLCQPKIYEFQYTLRHATIHMICFRPKFLVPDLIGWPVKVIRRKDKLHISVYRHYVASTN